MLTIFYFDNSVTFISPDSSLENAKPTVLYERFYTVDKGAAVELYCLGVGHPTAMTYTWTYDNKALEYSERVVKGDLGRKVHDGDDSSPW